MRAFLVLSLAFASMNLAACSRVEVALDEFVQIESADPMMATFKSGATGEEVRIAMLSALHQRNSSDPDLRSNDARKQIEAGIYMMDLGMPEITSVIANDPNSPVLKGAAYTEDGRDVEFAASLTNISGERALVLVLQPAGRFQQSRAIGLMQASWAADSPGLSPDTRATRQSTASSEGVTTTEARATSGAYPVPAEGGSNDRRWAGWHYTNADEAVARLGDAGTPRFNRYPGISPASAGPQAALEKAMTDFGAPNADFVKIIETKIARQLVGDPNYVTLGSSRRAGQDTVIFSQIYQSEDSSSLTVVLLEADRETFEQWGGIAAALSATSVIDSPNAIPAQYRSQLAKAPFDRQLAFYDMAYTRVMTSLFNGIIAANTSTLTLMQNINYDLVFDGSVSLETITGNK